MHQRYRATGCDEISRIRSIARLSITGLPPLLIAVLTDEREKAHIALCPSGRLRRRALVVDTAFSRSRELTDFPADCNRPSGQLEPDSEGRDSLGISLLILTNTFFQPNESRDADIRVISLAPSFVPVFSSGEDRGA